MEKLINGLSYHDLLIISSAINRTHTVPYIIYPYNINGVGYDLVLFVLKRDWDPRSQIILEKINEM